MATAHFLAAASNAPMDWVWGLLASVAFVAVIAIPAAALNARDRKRRQEERPATAVEAPQT
ncbi:MAG TPA: hypothetical protein VME46_01665 [Acidimicrobiales bacterium]|nr:hypothetical protein [Acidimicrobiales bacterium]